MVWSVVRNALLESLVMSLLVTTFWAFVGAGILLAFASALAQVLDIVLTGLT
jgi:hypothetical protein